MINETGLLFNRRKRREQRFFLSVPSVCSCRILSLLAREFTAEKMKQPR
jgi:hypothetical protein